MLNGTSVYSDTWVENNIQHILVYIYNDIGSPIGMAYRNSTMADQAYEYYFFAKNAQGDIVAIYNPAGAKLIEYTYDAWGNTTIAYHNGGASTSARYNSLTYRGYFYDSETGLYYLNSRYYDPAIGRFITPDNYINANGDITGFNMYAYCSDNPVNRIDRKGTNAEEALAWWASSMWWLCGSDTVLPFGDIIYAVGVVVLGITTIVVVQESVPQISFEEDPKEKTPDVTYPGDDPTKAPDGYEWRGPDEQGGKRGGYANPNGEDSWHPDLNHPDGIKPHWDYNDGSGGKWRVGRDFIERVK